MQSEQKRRLPDMSGKTQQRSFFADNCNDQRLSKEAIQELAQNQQIGKLYSSKSHQAWNSHQQILTLISAYEIGGLGKACCKLSRCDLHLCITKILRGNSSNLIRKTRGTSSTNVNPSASSCSSQIIKEQDDEPTPLVHLKKLTTEEIVAHLEKGLYNSCDEKFSPNHKC
ncbi:hypothetical protein CR513_05821, partial [Mucuna pruriens]